MAERVRVREISTQEGMRLLRIVRRGSGSMVTWRREQMVLWSAQAMDVAQIARVSFTSEDRVRQVLHNFNQDGFDSLYPRYSGGRPPTFTAQERAQIKQVALSRPQDHGFPFSTWSLSKLAEFVVRKGVVEDISHEGLRLLLREEGVSFQAMKTWKASTDPDFEPKKNRILHLYALADGKASPTPGDPDLVVCVDELGPLNLMPRPGKHWALAAGGGEKPRPRLRATYTRPYGVRHLLAAYDLQRDRLYGHIKPVKGRTAFLAFLRYIRSRHPEKMRMAIVLDNFSPHLSTGTDARIGRWAKRHNVELAYLPTYTSWLNRIEAQFTALRYFALNGTDHRSHQEQASLIRRYIIWRNHHAQDHRLLEIVKRANVA